MCVRPEANKCWWEFVIGCYVCLVVCIMEEKLSSGTMIVYIVHSSNYEETIDVISVCNSKLRPPTYHRESKNQERSEDNNSNINNIVKIDYIK